MTEPKQRPYYNSNLEPTQRFLRMVDITCYIGDYRLQLSLPRDTRVDELNRVIAGYQKLHREYGPADCKFIGVASMAGEEVLDYWLSLPDKNLNRVGPQLKIKALYSSQLSSQGVSKVSANQFEFLRCLGKGVSCSVFLVRSRLTGKYFALKRIQKRYISDYKTFENILREKKILTELKDNPHTVRFHCSFESLNHLNFLTDYYPGGQLFVHLQSCRLTEDQARNYFAEILAGMEFLHRNKILYRDMKPENVLVDLDGHLRIADFGLSKCCFQEQEFANTICGSQEYMAPEMYDRGSHGYNFSSDFYTLGVILYEFIVGVPPFYQDNMEYDRFSQKVQYMEPDMSSITNPDLRDLLEQLLHKNPEYRLSDFAAMKCSAWLKDIDWRLLQEKKKSMLPPAPYKLDLHQSYIHKQFADLVDEVEECNLYETETFEPLFQFFNYCRTQSLALILGMNSVHHHTSQSSRKSSNNNTNNSNSCLSSKYDGAETPTKLTSGRSRSKNKSRQGKKKTTKDQQSQQGNNSNRLQNNVSMAMLNNNLQNQQNLLHPEELYQINKNHASTSNLILPKSTKHIDSRDNAHYFSKNHTPQQTHILHNPRQNPHHSKGPVVKIMNSSIAIKQQINVYPQHDKSGTSVSRDKSQKKKQNSKIAQNKENNFFKQNCNPMQFQSTQRNDFQPRATTALTPSGGSKSMFRPGSKQFESSRGGAEVRNSRSKQPKETLNRKNSTPKLFSKSRCILTNNNNGGATTITPNNSNTMQTGKTSLGRETQSRKELLQQQQNYKIRLN